MVLVVSTGWGGEEIVLVRGVKRMDRLMNGCVKQDIEESL